MKGIYVTQTLEDWFVPVICIVDLAITILTAFAIAKNISTWREKALRQLPATFQDRTILQGAIIVLLILASSLLGRAVLAISIHIIAVIWLASEIHHYRECWPARRQMEQIAGLELADLAPRSGEHRRDSSEQYGRPDELPISSPAMARITEPPPTYTQYVPVHTTQKASGGECRSAVQDGIVIS